MALAEDIQPIYDAMLEHVPSVLRALKRYHGAKDDQLAEALGGKASRSYVQERLSGRTKMSIGDLGAFAAVFGIPPELLLGDADDAVRWTLDHAPDLRFGDSVWMFGQAETGTGSDLIAI